MTHSITDMEPKKVWYYFNEICKIPHKSEHEKALSDFIVRFAEERGLKYKFDKAGNLVVKKGPSKGCSSQKILVLQGHIDMVCVGEPGLKYDPLKDPIKPQINGEWVTAAGTSLGADNGIGVAAMLAVLDDDNLKHGPLEALFTVREEITLVGALNLGKDMLEGRTMLNFDSEEDDIIYIGCAGAGVCNVRFKFTKKKLPEGFNGLKIKVSGLRGGHSGLTIGEQRGNSIKILSRILVNIRKEDEMLIAHLDGGTARNVIPNYAEATVAVKASNASGIIENLKKLFIRLRNEYQTIDPDLKFEVEKVNVNDAIDQETTDGIIGFGYIAPAGVVTMSYDIKDFVQTSANMAMLKVEGDLAIFSFHCRSSVMSELEDVQMKIKMVANLAGGETEELGGYSGWKPNLKSPILNLAKEIYKELFGEEPKIRAIHAGLECGVIGETFGGMDMISISTTLENVHSVKERVNIKSVRKFYKFATRIVSDFVEPDRH